jgi:hypothetical protein
MPWPPDVPDFLFKKPLELEKLEKLPPEIIHAMTRVEIDEKIRDAADSLSKSYSSCPSSELKNYDKCVAVVSGALSETGSSLPGQLGSLMVGTGYDAAQRSCRQFFPEEE